MNEIVSGILMFFGATWLLLAAIGVLRMPDLFTRMSPATKGSTLGVTCMMLAVAVYFQDLSVTTRALSAVVFFFLTAPITAHMISRAAYFVGTPLWEKTIIDELRGNYDQDTHELGTGGPARDTKQE